MHTLNVRQLRALAIVAPGTLALSDSSTFARMTFLTTEDDTARSGVWRIDVDQAGNVTEHTTMGRGTIHRTYADLIAAEAEPDEDPYLSAALAEAEWADDAGMSAC